MPKMQELFKMPDGSKLLDIKLLMQVQDLPTSPVEKETDKGTKISVYPVKMVHQGQQYEWELSESQLNRIFTKSDKAGKVFWQARTGDVVNVWYARPKNPSGFNYFAAEPANTEEGAGAAVEMFSDGEMKPVIAANVAPSKPKFYKAPSTSDGAGAPKWDGTPRQSGFRQARAGLLQAILSNPNVNPFEDADVKKSCELADYLVGENRAAAKVLEESIKD